jgi:DNA-binding CsgD family transcriptional regulator
MMAPAYRLNEQEMQLMLGIIDKLNRSTNSKQIRQSIADDLLALTGADMFASFVWNDNLQQFDDLVYLNMSEANLNRYAEYYQYRDPITPHLQLRKEATLVNDVMAQDALERTEFFNDFLQADGLKWGINLYAYDGDLNVGDLRIWRNDDRTPFSSREVVLLNMLKPHFTNAMINAKAMRAIREKVSGWHDLWEHHPNPCFVFNSELKNIHRNQAALALIKTLTLNEQLLMLEAAFQYAKSDNANEYWQGYRLSLSKSELVLEDRRDLSMIQLNPQSKAVIDQEWILRRFNLTPTEAKMCLLMLRGMTDQSMAEHLFRSVWTVRAHTKSIFEKLKVAGRAELTHLITTTVADIKLPNS